jgi:hypothetical protein
MSKHLELNPHYAIMLRVIRSKYAIVEINPILQQKATELAFPSLFCPIKKKNTCLFLGKVIFALRRLCAIKT